MAPTNRRGFPRIDEEATIQVLASPEYSQKREDDGVLIPAKMCNQSTAGLCIEIGTVLHPGSTVRLKMVSPEEDHPSDAHYIIDGRVIWCKKADAKTSRFGAGIKILRRVVEADVLTSRFKDTITR